MIDEAETGQIAFPGGLLTFSPTPAMTVVDIDGDIPPRLLALAAAAPWHRQSGGTAWAEES